MGTWAVKDMEPVHLLLQKQLLLEAGQALIIILVFTGAGESPRSPLWG